MTLSGGVYSLPLSLPAGAASIDRLAVGEDQAFGQRILQFSVVGSDGSTVLASGQSVGNKRIFLLAAPISAPATLTLRVQAAKAQPVIRILAAYSACPTG